VTETHALPIMMPTAPKAVEELFGQFGKLAPTALDEYGRDFWQRSILFLDILRQRGNQREEMIAHGIASVLIYDTELIMRGDALPRPVNYSLLRVVPPVGVAIDGRKRPVVVIDPRAGQGPGIGGFKPVSEIGDAFKAGHPVYFIGFSADPIEGQRIEDIARAHTVFIEKVDELHPGALGRPFVVGNCQAGWHAMMAACMRPDLVGPILIAGAPLSYWLVSAQILLGSPPDEWLLAIRVPMGWIATFVKCCALSLVNTGAHAEFAGEILPRWVGNRLWCANLV